MDATNKNGSKTMSENSKINLGESVELTAQDWVEYALSLCKGGYQRDIVTGAARISGSDLRGRAREYSGSYKKSRDAILERMSKAGIPWKISKGEKGLLSLEIG